MEIGKKIRALRLKRNLTQEELADRAELTKGFISQIENEQSNISLDALSNLLEALGTSLSVFFKDEDDKRIVFTEDDFYEKTEEEYSLKFVVPNAQKNNLQPVLITLNVSGESYEYEPFEGEIFGMVLDGEIKVSYGEQINRIRAGETLFTRGMRKMKLTNIGDKEAKIICVAHGLDF